MCPKSSEIFFDVVLCYLYIKPTGNNQVVQEVKLNMETEFATMGVQSLVLSQAANSVLFKFSNSAGKVTEYVMKI